MKIIIAGDGKMGAALTRKLSAEGDDLTLIDSNPEVLESSEERGGYACHGGQYHDREVYHQEYGGPGR